MAGQQDILDLGLNISSFDEKKKKQIQEYIVLFNQLDKYDGKVWNPILGNGLSEFNASIKQTNSLITELNSKINSLNSSTNQNTNINNQNTASTNVNTQSRKKNTQSQFDSISAQVRSAEAATKLAAADTKKASADSIAANAALRLASANLSVAKSSEKAELTTKRNTAAQTAAAASLTARVAAERQLVAAEYQVSLANEMSSQAANQNAAAQSAAASAVNRAAIAATGAGSAISSANANIAATSIQVNAATASTGIALNSLSRAFGQLRVLAYILPGIGIAGIFNLIFEAIGSVIEAFTGLGGTLVKTIKHEEELNKALNQQIGLYEKLVSVTRDYYENFNKSSATTLDKKIEIFNSEGIEKGTILVEEIQALIKRVDDSKTGKFTSGFLSLPFLKDRDNQPLNIGGELTPERIETIKRVSKEALVNIKALDNTINRYSQALLIFNGVKVDKKVAEAKIEAAKSEKEQEVSKYKVLTDVLKEYYGSQQELEKKNAEYKKFLSDEALREFVNKKKEEIATSVDANKVILDDARTSEKEQLSILKKLRDSEKELNDIERISVTGVTKEDASKYGVSENVNVSATAVDVINARKKQAEANKRLDIEFEKDSTKVRTEFYQRLILAREKIEEESIERQAINAERVYKNEEKTLQERLAAYTKYVISKQKIEDIQLAKDLQKDAEKNGGKTSLTVEEQAALKVSTSTRKSNIQADIEKQVYNIVYSSLQNQLKEVKKANKLKEEDNKEAHAKELTALNQQLESKSISINKWQSERKRIDEKFRIQGLDRDIQIDEENINRIVDQQIEIYKKAEKSGEDLRKAKAGSVGPFQTEDQELEAKAALDLAVGNENAINDAIIEADLELDAAQRKLHADKLKRAQQSVDAEKASAKERSNILRGLSQIEKSIYQAAKAASDDEYKYQTDKVNQKKSVIDEEYGYETEAIERSTLYEKDKTRIGIQLAAERAAADKKLALEQKKLAHDKAVYDRDLAIVHIILSTAVAVAENLSVPILAFAAAFAGAAELAVAQSVHIPGYEKGTGKQKHKGGLARTGEKGKPELIIEPYKSPYLVHTDNVSYLPPGTEVIPMTGHNLTEKSSQGDGWAQAYFLAKRLKPKQQQTNITNIIKIDTRHIAYRDKILGK